MIAAAFVAGLIGVEKEQEVVHVFLDDCINQVTNGRPLLEVVCEKMNRAVGRQTKLVQLEGIDPGAIVLAALQVLVWKNKFSASMERW